MNELTIKECKHHGQTEFVKEKRGYFRCKKCRSFAVLTKRRRLKLRAVEYKGGACAKCGYNKCRAALDFHHINGKDFSLATRGLTRSWEKIKRELDRCELLCANCHREEHAEKYEWLHSSLIDYVPQVKKIWACKDCGVTVSTNASRCKKCSKKAQEKVIWPPIDVLEKMVETYNYTQVGKLLGVSDNAVRKHIRIARL